MKSIITSAGVIKNPDKPRTGIVSLHSLADWIFDEIDNGIDLTFEAYCDELRAEGLEEDSSEWQRRMDFVEFDTRTILFGDWKKNSEGKYEIDRDGKEGFSAEYNSETGLIAVEWSKITTRCHYTSPCYVMADGSGPCGDLDTKGDAILAYTLPAEFFRKD